MSLPLRNWRLLPADKQLHRGGYIVPTWSVHLSIWNTRQWGFHRVCSGSETVRRVLQWHRMRCRGEQVWRWSCLSMCSRLCHQWESQQLSERWVAEMGKKQCVKQQSLQWNRDEPIIDENLIKIAVADRLYGNCEENGQCVNVRNTFCDTDSDVDGGFCQCRPGFHNVNHVSLISHRNSNSSL